MSLELFIGGKKLGVGRSGVLFSLRLCAVTQAMLQSGGVGAVGGVSHRDNLSPGSLMENREALHPAWERAAAAGISKQPPTPLHHSWFTARALQKWPPPPCDTSTHHGLLSVCKFIESIGDLMDLASVTGPKTSSLAKVGVFLMWV